MAGWRGARSWRRLGWARWLRVCLACAVVTLGLELVPPGLGVPGAGALAAVALTPASPPAPVSPAPRVATVTTAGPTQVSGTLAADTVWSPQGSPYMVSGLTIPAGVELTLLPGTVVKMAWQQGINVYGSLLVLGDPGNHVVITSARDDTVMGDSNGDGNATSPAAGDWYSVSTFSGGVAVFDYADVRYGGWGSSCHAYGAIGGSGTSELIVSDSSITDSANAAVAVGTGYQPSVGIYNSYIARSCTGVAATQPAELDVIGNTFDMPSGSTALFLLYPQKTRVWFNTVNGLSAAAGSSPVTRAMADVRFNQLGGIYDYGAADQQLNDWSDNWWGHDANAALPACMDPGRRRQFHAGGLGIRLCQRLPGRQYQVTGYSKPVLPALPASPQVLPASLREAAAPRFGPVDTYSGALTYQADDMAVQDAGKTITASRTTGRTGCRAGTPGPAGAPRSTRPCRPPAAPRR